MADPHPIIILESEPSTDCPNPAYNCVQYCFEDPDFEQQIGTRANFKIEVPFGTASYVTGLAFTVAGQGFLTSVATEYNLVMTTGPYTQAEFAQNFKTSFELNSYLFNNFTFEIIGGIELVATARKVGVLNNFDFDFSALAPSPLKSFTQGTDDTFRENYGLVVEIWKSFLGATIGDMPISSESYTPSNDGTFCINIGEKIAPLLETRYVFDEPTFDTASWFRDRTIIDTFIIRYGRSYSDNIGDCEVESRNFASTDEIRVINSAFQKGSAIEQTEKICDPQWMTNMPQYSQVCENTDVVMWINAFDLIENQGVNLIRPYLVVTFTDGTTEPFLLTPFSIDPQAPNNIFACVYSAARLAAIETIFNKKIRTFECRLVEDPANNFFASQHFKRVSCCDGDIAFQFLNEFGGYDPILFTQITAIDLEQESTPFEGFLGCDQNGLRGGVDIVGQTAGDIYTVTSKFLNNYQNIRWIREFLASPLKYVFMEVDGVEIQSKVISLSNTTRYFSQDNTLLITLEFTLNESLNLHKN